MTLHDSRKLPGPDHPIAIEPNPKRVQVRVAGRVIADSRQALVLRETSYPPVQYVPRSDVDMATLERSRHATTCPYKGDASYFTIYRDTRVVENAVWSYEDPFPAVGLIGGRVAFYPEYVDFQLASRTPTEAETLGVDEVIRHTDSGSGHSQAEHWPPKCGHARSGQDRARPRRTLQGRRRAIAPLLRP